MSDHRRSMDKEESRSPSRGGPAEDVSSNDVLPRQWPGILRHYLIPVGLPLPRPTALFCGAPAPQPHPVGAAAHQTTRSSAKLSHSFIVSGRRRNTPKSDQNRSESLCAGLWVSCRIFWVWFGPALAPNPARNRRFPAGSLNIFGALLAQPRQLRGA